jgi:hypothetical protein
MRTEDHVEVYSAIDSFEAHLVRNLLIDEGVEAIVVGDAAEGAVGERSPFSTPPRVWVPPGDLERSQPIVEQYQQQLIRRAESQQPADDSAEATAAESTGEPYCYHCGEPIAAGQTPCPSCGQALDWNATRSVEG